MSVIGVSEEMLAAKFEAIFPHLDERQRLLVMGAEARALGHGGIRLVARATWVRVATVSAGLGTREPPLGRAPAGRGPQVAGRPGWAVGAAAAVDPLERETRCRRCGGRRSPRRRWRPN
jgi:hypothetical protein